MIPESPTSPQPVDIQQLPHFYETRLLQGPFPLAERRSARLSADLYLDILYWTETIAGLACCGPCLATIPESRKQLYRKLLARTVWDQYPMAKKKITPEKAPRLYQLLVDSEIARELISEYLGPERVESPTQ
jgi:hypothetical protein